MEDFEADLDRLPVRIGTDTVIDIDSSRKLADYFGVSAMYFYNLQQDINARNKIPKLMTIYPPVSEMKTL